MVRMIVGGILAVVGIIWLAVTGFAFNTSTFNPSSLILPVVVLLGGLLLIFWGATTRKK